MTTKPAGAITRKYRTVPAGVRRVLYRGNLKPPRLYMISEFGVAMCNPRTFDRKKLLKRGYVKVKMVTKNRNQEVYEKRVKK